MNKPNLQEIQENSILLDRIEQYKKSIVTAKSQLEDTKSYYIELEKIEKQKIYDDLRQKDALQQLNSDIKDYRNLEQIQKAATFAKVQKAFDIFLDSVSMKSVISDTMKAFNGEAFEIICDPKYKVLLPSNSLTTYKDGQIGQIRLVSMTREYILDPEHLKKLLFDHFIVSSVSAN